jgi:excisionase family DNA binding protein
VDKLNPLVSDILASPYLTTTEAAAYIRSTVQGIYALVKRGRVRPMPGRPGRLLFTREALDKYLGGKFRR